MAPAKKNKQNKQNSSGEEQQQEQQQQQQHGTIFSISGPVIVAENMIGCAMYELVGAGAPGFSCLPTLASYASFSNYVVDGSAK